MLVLLGTFLKEYLFYSNYILTVRSFYTILSIVVFLIISKFYKAFTSLNIPARWWKTKIRLLKSRSSTDKYTCWHYFLHFLSTSFPLHHYSANELNEPTRELFCFFDGNDEYICIPLDTLRLHWIERCADRIEIGFAADAIRIGEIFTGKTSNEL